MKWTEALVAGIGQHLADNTEATWRVAGDYAEDDPWPVIVIAVPASPDQIITLTPYPVDEDPATSDVTQGLQVRTRGPRGDPRPVDAINDEIFDALHGLTSVVLNGIPVVQAYRTSGSYLGADTNGRHEHSANYYVQCARPSPYRTD